MKNKDTNNYYMTIKTKMMREFSKMFKGATKSLIHHFDNAKIDELQATCKSEYITLLPELPYIGGKKNKNTINLIVCTVILAMLNPLEKEGLSKHQIGKIIFDTFDGYFKAIPGFIRFSIRKIASSKFFVNSIKKQNKQSLLKKYKDDFVIEDVESNGEDFDFAYNYTECAIHKLFTKKNKVHYLQYVCLGDYAMYKSFGIGFFRTQTIANGDPICDFRFKKKTETSSGWPPEKLKEWKVID